MQSSLREQKQMPTEICLVHFNVSLSSSGLILINAEPHTKKKIYYLMKNSLAHSQNNQSWLTKWVSGLSTQKGFTTFYCPILIELYVLHFLLLTNIHYFLVLFQINSFTLHSSCSFLPPLPQVSPPNSIGYHSLPAIYSSCASV